MDELNIYTDGGSRGNPGKSAIGIVMLDKDEKILLEHGEFLGVGTNNQAEYRAIIKALGLAKKFLPKSIYLFSDSELVIRQLRGEYKINNQELLKLNKEVKGLEKNYAKVEYSNVRRENKFTSIADSLVNRALDEN